MQKNHQHRKSHHYPSQKRKNGKVIRIRSELTIAEKNTGRNLFTPDTILIRIRKRRVRSRKMDFYFSIKIE